MLNVYLAFHKLLHALILVLLEDGSYLGDEPFMDGDTEDCQRYAGDKPCRLTEEIIDSTDTSQREEKGDGIKINLQISSLHAEHGSLEYLQTEEKSAVGRLKRLMNTARQKPLISTWIPIPTCRKRNGRVSNKATALTTI